MTEKYLMANNLRLAYDEFGDASHPAIILIMGLGTQMIAWPVPFCESLAEQGFRVIRFDNRDIGLSQKIEPKRKVSILQIIMKQRLRIPFHVPYRLRDMAKDTIGLIDALGLQKVHWVGASMGGMIAQLLAAEYPERTLSLTSIMSTTGNPDLPKVSLKVSKQMINRPSAEDQEAYLKHAMATWAIIGSPDYPPSKEDLSAKILNSLNRSYYPKGYLHQMAAIIENGDRRGVLRKIKAPTLVIHGKADVLVPVEGGIDTAENIPNAELKLISGMGHDLPKELIPRFSRYIGEHIQKSA
jgi:pimeloyl-ACP methyl ester carboxylesterase